MSYRQRWLVLTLATLVGVVATGLLGRWQLSRADMRERQQMSIDAKRQLPALNTQTVARWATGSSDDELAMALHRTALLRGQWIAQQTVFLDNRQMFGRPGFYVLTPLQLEASSSVLLVQRGWVARNFVDRSQLPIVPSPKGWVEVSGRLAGSPARLLEFDTPATPASDAGRAALPSGEGKSAIRQNLDLKAFAKETGLALLPMTLLQTDQVPGVAVSAAADGLQRDWPLVNSGASKNYGYAVQWFALSALIAGLYGWFQFGKPYVAKKRS